MILTHGLNGALDLAALKIFRTFRILRALRPLRIVARSVRLRVLVSTILSAAKVCAVSYQRSTPVAVLFLVLFLVSEVPL